MPIQYGEDFVLKVNTTGSTFVAVADMNRFNKNTQRNTSKFPVFNRATPYAVPGSRDRTYQVSGLFNDDDAGQAALRTAEAANTPIKIQVLFDGTNGFEQEVLVSSFTHDADPEGIQQAGFNFEANADATIVGTGPIL